MTLQQISGGSSTQTLGLTCISKAKLSVFPLLFLHLKRHVCLEKGQIVTTPTQPQLNSKVGYDMKMNLAHHPPPPHTLNVINFLAVPDPI